MSEREPKLYLEDIRTSIERIEKYTENLTFEDFSKNIIVIDAVLRNLSIIGEAAKNLPEEIKSKYPDIPWNEIMGMRNKVIHEYFGVDEGILWKTIKDDLPALSTQISKILELLK